MKKIILLLPILFAVNFAFAENVTYCPSLTKNLKRGYAGVEVKELQKFLSSYYPNQSANFPNNLANSKFVFGPTTEKLVAQFQGENNLVVSGIVGAVTRTKIASVCVTKSNLLNPDISQDYSKVRSGIYQEDFNFDGLMDKLDTTNTGKNAPGGYVGGQIYVQTTSGNYVLSDELSKIYYNGDRGYFKVDRKNKMILTGGNMGGGQYIEQKYIVVPSVGLKETSKIIKDGNGKLISNEISVPGMQKYTDDKFGFSFWYPSSWKAEDNTCGMSTLPDTCLSVFNERGQTQITFLRHDDANLTFNVTPGACGSCGPVKFYYDTSKHLWMKVYPNGALGGDVPESVNILAKIAKPADTSINSMGGLHVWHSEQKESARIVPLSARHFLFVRDNKYSDVCGSYCSDSKILGGAQYIANTIVATDPSVATPVSISEQQKVVESERKAYLGY